MGETVVSPLACQGVAPFPVVAELPYTSIQPTRGWISLNLLEIEATGNSPLFLVWRDIKSAQADCFGCGLADHPVVVGEPFPLSRKASATACFPQVEFKRMTNI